MKLNDRVTLFAQTKTGQITDEGIHSSGRELLGLSAELGLLVLAQGYPASAQISLEILLDDMSLNQPAIDVNSSQAGAEAALCLSESLDNINEYLNSQTDTQTDDLAAEQGGVAMAAIMLLGNQLSCVQLGVLCCLRYSAEQLQAVTKESAVPDQLGQGQSIHPSILQHELVEGDIFILTTNKFVQEITLEFMRLTLSRFSDNLDMAMRQINTRALRNGLAQKPDIVLCRIDPISDSSKSWLGKLRGSK